MDLLTENIILACVLGLFAVMAAIYMPSRALRKFSFRVRIAAPRERVWDLTDLDSGSPESAAFHDRITAVRDRGGDPPRIEVDYALDGGGARFTTTHEVLTERKPEISVTRLLHWRDNRPDLAPGEPTTIDLPFGPDERESFELTEHPGGTTATVSWRGETGNIAGFLYLWLRLRVFWRRLKVTCETGRIVPAGKTLWPSGLNAALSVAALASFALMFGWQGAVMVAAVIVVHEFGHWIAMRQTGQPAPRIVMVPFLGAVCVPNHPYRTLFDDAYCSLMGAGLSALPCLALAGLAYMLEMPAAAGNPPAPLSPERLIPTMMAIMGGVNAAQLIPVLPLDGGHVLRTVIQSFRTGWARPVMMVLTGAGAAGFAAFGDYVAGAFLGLGVLQAWYIGNRPTGPRRMSGPGVTVICLGYGLVLAVHLTAFAWGIAFLYGIDIVQCLPVSGS